MYQTSQTKNEFVITATGVEMKTEEASTVK